MSLLLLLCDWGEALFGRDDYYQPGINQIPTAHCVYVFLFSPCLSVSLLSSHASVCCSRRAAWIHICFSLFLYYCIIDGETLHVALERTCERDNDFSLSLVLFFVVVCLLRHRALSNTLGAFLILCEQDYSTIEIINKPLLLSGTLNILTLPWEINKCSCEWVFKARTFTIWCLDLNQISWPKVRKQGSHDRLKLRMLSYKFH